MDWKTILSKFFENAGNRKSSGANLYKRLTHDCTTVLSASKEYFVELCHQIWTTNKNLEAWFDKWKKFCVEKGNCNR